MEVKMKTYLFLIAVAMVLILFTGESFGKSMTKRDSSIERGVTNLIYSLSSENYGVKTSAGIILGDLKNDRAVIPLMRILNSSDDETMRVIAALSLYKIQDPIGMYAVKQAIRFDESPRVRKLCTYFYVDSKRKEMAAAKQKGSN